jgi:hypothetical protein
MAVVPANIRGGGVSSCHFCQGDYVEVQPFGWILGGKLLSYFLGVRVFQVIVVGLLSTWVSERWVLRDADACSADSVSMMAGRILYSFKDRFGEYYGGEGFPFALVCSPQLARIVFYRTSKPELNNIASGCLFIGS